MYERLCSYKYNCFMIDIKPPIIERSTEELLEIVGLPKDWKPEIVDLAMFELKKRKIDKQKIDTAKYLSQKRERIKKSNKANESLLWDFIGDPLWTIVIILFSWELKKDGFDRKAKEQRVIRLTLLSIAVLILAWTLLY